MTSAIGSEMKECACSWISIFALPSSRTMASVAPPRGEKKTSMDGAATPWEPAVVVDGEEQERKKDSVKAIIGSRRCMEKV